MLTISGLHAHLGRGSSRRQVLHDIDIRVEEGETVGVVGESGSGKSTLARVVSGLIPRSAGSVVLDGAPLRNSRPNRQIQLVFQNPMSALNPKMTVERIIAEGLGARRVTSSVRAGVRRALEEVHLEPNYASARPRELSGGQRQRVVIARALVARPRLLIADEVTSALDVSAQASILNLLREIHRSRETSMLFISHDLAVVRYIADTVVVLHQGKIVESGPAEPLFANPRTDYVKELVSAIPDLAPVGTRHDQARRPRQ